MGKAINKVMYVFIILLSLVMFSFNAKASSVSCTYSDGNVGIVISYNDKSTDKTLQNISKKGFTMYKSVDVSKSDFQDENENFICPNTIYFFVSPMAGRTAYYNYNFNEANSPMPLVDSEIINDTNTGNGGGNDSKKIIRQCKYDEFVVYYFSDGTYSAEAASFLSVGITPPEEGSFKDYCLTSIYVATAETSTGKTAAIRFESFSMSKKYYLTDGDTYQQFIDNQKTEDDKSKFDINGNTVCESLFGDKDKDIYPAYWIQWCLNLIKYIAIVALLVLVTIDFVKALVSGDKDALKKAGTTAIKRFIFCVLIFFLPIIVEFIMSLFGAYGTCDIG